MEQLAFLAAVVIAILVISLLGIRNERRARARFLEKMRKSYGQEPEHRRDPSEHAYIRSYFEYHKPGNALDDITWNDLGMDAVFARLNYCRSAAGEEVLYSVLRTPSTADTDRFEEQVAFFDRETEARVVLQGALEESRQISKYSAYDHLNELDRGDARSNTRHYLMLGLIVFCILGCVSGRVSLFFPPLLALIILNVVTYYREKEKVNLYLSTFEYILRLLYGSEKIRKTLSDPSYGDLFTEDVSAIDRELKAMQSFRRGSYLVMARPSSTGDPVEIIFDYLRMVTHMDLIKFNSMFRHLIKHEDNVDRLIAATGRLDARISVACFRASLAGAYCLPEEAEGTTLVLEDAYHPLVEGAVGNSITCDRNVLITGSNASGKSTFLKTVAICAVLAQSIRTVPAKRYAAPLYRIYSSMALNDNLEAGESYYMVEIKSLKRILEAAKVQGLRVLCFIDEVLRGTNTLERIAASAQVLKQFANENVQCFAATHDGELTEILKSLYDNYHFDGDLTDGDVRFDYRLREGSAKTRNAIRLLQQIGYDDAIVKNAEEMAAHFLATGVWTLM